MTQPRPLTAEDYETIRIRAPRSLGLSGMIATIADHDSKGREETAVAGLAKGLLAIGSVALLKARPGRRA